MYRAAAERPRAVARPHYRVRSDNLRAAAAHRTGLCGILGIFKVSCRSFVFHVFYRVISYLLSLKSLFLSSSPFSFSFSYVQIFFFFSLSLCFLSLSSSVLFKLSFVNVSIILHNKNTIYLSSSIKLSVFFCFSNKKQTLFFFFHIYKFKKIIKHHKK